jgi:diguanylate cyclase (GGDEF)-like protein
MATENTYQVKKYSYKEINASMDSMRVMFDIVRLVDAEECREVNISADGELCFGRECYAVWNADHRCANCTSFQACHTQSKKSRVEYFNGKTFQIQSVPIVLTLKDESPYCCNLELISFTDDAASDAMLQVEKDKWETSGYLSTHDTLTGILNWDGFCKGARNLISNNPEKKHFVISADVDNFRLVNTLFGNSKGNEVLVGIAKILEEMCGSSGVAGRCGGVNFALCIDEKNDLEKWLRQISSKVAELIHSPSFTLTMHFGIFDVKNQNLPISIMYDRSYMALESIRTDESIFYTYFTDELLEQAVHEQKIINEFKSNLKSGQFIIYLQPQVTKDGVIEGAECLVRWCLPSGDVLPPLEFIEILEQVGLIGSLDEYVWELAAKQLSKWKGTEFDKLYLSVNVSPKDFYYLDIAKIFPALCKKYDISPSKLHIEITETAIADEMSGNMAILESLQANGFTVEIDDFGKGSSSLGLLKDLKADVLKIDMRFIQRSSNDDRSNVILESVIDMAKKLHMEVISEGIETKAQLNNLSELGCDVFQGFYFSKPIPVAAFEQYAKKIL